MKKITASYEEGLQERLKSPSFAYAYLNAALDEADDLSAFVVALGDVVKAHGVGSVARSAKMQRDTIYKAIKEDANPTLKSVFAIMKSLDLEFRIAPPRRKAG